MVVDFIHLAQNMNRLAVVDLVINLTSSVAGEEFLY
jgi:hypothetical protein